MFLYIVILAAAIYCALEAIRSSRLLHSALWLAGTSALVALVLYLLGAAEVAVIELSVGAGLVTVLFVFAINIAGEETFSTRNLVPRPLAWGLAIGSFLLLGYFNISQLQIPATAGTGPGFFHVVWQVRGLDILLQVALIFAGVLGVLGLLTEGKPGTTAHPRHLDDNQARQQEVQE